MNKNDCFELGYITKTHGIKGEVSVYLDVDYPDDYEDMDSVFVEIKKSLIPFIIKDINVIPNKKNTAIIKFEDIDTIDKAKDLIGCALYLPLEALPELGDTEFYYHEIVGFQVLDEQEKSIGEVKNVYDFSSNALLAVDYQGKEVLIPVNDHTVIKVDRAQKQLVMHIPDGLVDVFMDEKNK